MSRTARTSLCAVALAVFGRVGLAADGPANQIAKDEHTLRLIQLLGADQFSVRENATEQLIEIGLPAQAALETGRKSPDREIRYRCERILSVIYEIDFRRRLEAFSASRDPNEDFDLPGWQPFRNRMGSDVNSRSLFVLMQKEESEALKAIAENPKTAAERLETRTQQLMQTKRLLRTETPLGSIAAMLFLAGEGEVTVSPQTSSTLYSLCYEQTFRNSMTQGEHRDLMRKLLGDWVGRGEDWNAYQGLALSMQYELKEGLVAAERALKNQAASHVRQYAILALAKLGSQEHIPLLEPLLEDDTRTSSRRVNKLTFETQVRDVALAAMIHLAKQDPKKFGFKNLRAHSQVVFNTSYLGFANEEERAAALQKWKEFREKQDAAEANSDPQE